MRIALIVLLGLTGAATAAPLDPEVGTPYRIRVAVKAASHPTLNVAVRAEIARAAAATLRKAAGDAATLEIIDLNAAVPPDPLLRQFAQVGFKAFDAVGDSPARLITGMKTHALTVEYRDGTFHLSARQHDGSTGLASPMVRTQANRNPDMLGRLAGMLVEPDFGAVGTVVPVAGLPDGHMRLVLRGSQTGPFDQWAKVGDVFAPSVIMEVPDPVADKKNPVKMRVGIPIGHTNTLLRVAETKADGSCVCVLLSRYKAGFEFGNQSKAKAAVGVRAVKLATIEAPVRLRLINKDGQPHARGSRLTVTASDADFRTRAGPAGQFNLSGGVYQSAGPLNGVACVLVAVGGDAPRLFPVPVLGPDPVTLLFEVSERDEKRAEFADRIKNLRGRIAEVGDAQFQLFTKVNQLIDQRKNKAALTEAEGGYGRVQAAEEGLRDDLKQIQTDPQAADENVKVLLADCEARLKGVTDTQAKLQKTTDLLRNAAAAAPGGTEAMDKDFRAKELAARIQEFLGRGEIDDALVTYGQLIQLQPDDQGLKDKREQLQKEWAPQDEEHRKARDAWRKWKRATTVDEFVDAAAGLTPALEVLNKKKDKYGVRWAMGILEQSLARIQGLVDGSDKETEEGAKALAELNKFRVLVGTLDEKARKYLTELAK